MRISLPYGHETLDFEIPPQNLLQVLKPNNVLAEKDADKEINDSMDYPVGCMRFDDVISSKIKGKPSAKVCIISDDITRSTPTDRIIPIVIKRLNNLGIQDQNIYIVMALGSHRYMTEDEIKHKVSNSVYRKIRVYNSQFNIADELVNLGTTGSGVPLLLDRRVSQADVKIGIGNIVPHPVMGWSGGAKILFPGVTGKETVTAFHLNYAKFGSNMFGADTTPVREEIEEWAGIIGLDFIINCACLPDGCLYKVICGHYIEAQRKGIKYSREIYGVLVNEKAELTIVSSYPADLDLWQATKAVCGAEHATKDGGEILLVTPCYEGLGPHADLDVLIRKGKDDPDGLLEKSLADGSMDGVAASGAIHLGKVIGRRKTIGLVSSHLTGKQVENMGWKKYENVNQAIGLLLKKNNKAGINVITHGGYLCPI